MDKYSIDVRNIAIETELIGIQEEFHLGKVKPDEIECTNACIKSHIDNIRMILGSNLWQDISRKQLSATKLLTLRGELNWIQIS